MSATRLKSITPKGATGGSKGGGLDDNASDRRRSLEVLSAFWLQLWTICKRSTTLIASNCVRLVEFLAKKLLAIGVLRTPQAEGDTLTADGLMAEYADLRHRF